MLSEDDLVALMAARHPNPFSVLGLHADEKGRFWVRALLPGAREVSLLDKTTGEKIVGLQARNAEGFFEAMVPGRKKRFVYQFAVKWHHGQEGVYEDAYRFLSSIGEQDLYFLGEGSHLRPYTVLGAHPMTIDGVSGVRFAVWAPNAQRVSVVGDFNAWDSRRHPMRVHYGIGVWEIFIPHVAVGDCYKYEIRTRHGWVLPQKADPYAFATEKRPSTASVVGQLPPLHTLPDKRQTANQREAPISIYEMHLGSWQRNEEGGFLTWDELALRVPAYVKTLGFTHIELLPVTEHPFDGSWGYQTLSQFSPTARFGDPAGLQRFVEACHQAGLGLILDWVPGHFPIDAHGLAQFDGTALYEYPDPKEGYHQDWNTAIYNFSRTEVRNFLTASALFWAERYGFDGLRVDAVASMLYRDYSREEGQWIPNVHGGRENLEAISLLKHINVVLGEHAPGVMTLAEESTAFPGVSKPVFAGGLGFYYKWNMGWMHDTLKYMQTDPIYRRWHQNQLTFGLIYAFSENFVLPLSHDEVVHGKGSLISKMPGDRWQRFANLRAYYGFMWAHPGKKLLFMGGEFAQEPEWNAEASLDWRALERPEHQGVQRLVTDLNQLYRTVPALHRLDCMPEGFQWMSLNDAHQSVIAFIRTDGTHKMLVVCNFTPVPRTGYRLGVPGGHGWREVLNTDAALYGGSNCGNQGGILQTEFIPIDGQPASVVLTLPPLGTIYLECV